MVFVSAALIWDKDKFMICQRPRTKARGLLWEFVGGKVELGETFEEALTRECQEELGCTVIADSIYTQLVHKYSDMEITLTLFNAHITNGEPKLIEHEDIKWITVDEIDNYEFCPADTGILKMLKDGK